MKKKSDQAIKDENRMLIIQNEDSTSTAKERAYNQLFNEHSKQLKIYFLQRTRDENSSEDLIIETFRKVFVNASSFDKEVAVFSTWLYKIANNTLIDLTRKATMEVFSIEAMVGKSSEENEGMDFQIMSNSLNPEEELSNTALGKEIHDAIYALPNALVRDVMVEMYINELSFKEMAEKLGHKEDSSTLRVQANRGRKIISKKLSHLKHYAR